MAVPMVLRSKSQLIGGIGTAVVGGGIGFGSVFSAQSTAFAFLWGATGSLVVFLGARLAMACVRTSDSGVHVRNFFGSVDLGWTEISRFEIGRWKLFPAVCIIRLNDGHQAHAFGLQESTNFPNQSAQRMIDMLNEELLPRVKSSGGP